MGHVAAVQSYFTGQTLKLQTKIKTMEDWRLQPYLEMLLGESSGEYLEDLN